MERIYIVGTGGCAKEVAWLIEDINEASPQWEIAGFIDDDIDKRGKTLNGYEILGDVEYLNSLGSVNVVIGIGSGAVRKSIHERLEDKKYPVLVHPKAVVSKHCTIGEGTFVCAGNIISVDAVIGRFNSFNMRNIVGHDCILGDYVSVFANASISGDVKIGEGSTIGSGSTIIQGNTVGKNCLIGIGSSVIKKVKDNHSAYGVPAQSYPNA